MLCLGCLSQDASSIGLASVLEHHLLWITVLKTRARPEHSCPAGDVSPKAMTLLLRWIYTDSTINQWGRLPGWLMRKLPEGVEEMFDAADRFLVFPLKVRHLLCLF